MTVKKEEIKGSMAKGMVTRKPLDNRKWTSMKNFEDGLNAIADEF